MVVFIIVIIIVYILQGIFFGVHTQRIIENKGYCDNWFWWGFFFGMVAVTKALAKPELQNNTYDADTFLEKLSKDSIPGNYRWECPFCHSVNENIVSTCSCGKSMEDGRKYIKAQNRYHGEQKIITLLNEYKKLMDNGIITQEEFDVKKKELLNQGD